MVSKKGPNKIKTEQGKEILTALEKEGRYVFHGSTELLEKLEPRQAKIWDKDKKEMIKHGEPSVVATPFAEIAIDIQSYYKQQDQS